MADTPETTTTKRRTAGDDDQDVINGGEEQEDAEEETLARYDLTHKIAPYLDVHLVLPLLEFLEENTAFDAKSVQRARLELLAPTNMVDYAIEIHTALTGGEDSTEAKDHATAEMFSKRRDAVFDSMEALERKTDKVRNVLDDKDKVAALQRDGIFTPSTLHSEYGVTPIMLDDYYENAKFLYECGDYETAHDMLEKYLLLFNNNNNTGGSNPASTSTTTAAAAASSSSASVGTTTTTTGATSPQQKQRYADALWGKFASEVLLKNWDNALADLHRLRTVVDERHAPPLEQLQQRSWLLHWSLFVFFNHDKGHDGIIDLFLSEKYLQAIQTNCPWLLRYLTTAVVINRRRRATLKDLVRVVAAQETEKQQQQRRQSSSSSRASFHVDPVTRFVDCLYVKFDFDGARTVLRECERALRADYFLCNCADAFMDDARMFVFETDCRIHTKIDVPSLATKLAMDDERAEKWVVDLIRAALLDAKIDSKHNCVVMGHHAPDVYTQVIEKTRDLLVRSNALINNIEHKVLANDRKQAAALAAAQSSSNDRD